MSLYKMSLSIAAALVGLAATGPMARAAFVVTMQQVGSNVVATGSGSLNTAAFSKIVGSTTEVAGIQPNLDFVTVGPAVSTPIDLYSGSILGPANFGSGGQSVATSGSGDLVFSGGSNTSFLYVPQGYISGNPLSDTSTWANSTFSSLGITPGTYKWTWGAVGAGADSFTLVATAVPEPATLALFGVAGLSLLARRRRA